MARKSHSGAAIASRSHKALKFRPAKASGVTPIGPFAPNNQTVGLGEKRRRFNLRANVQ